MDKKTLEQNLRWYRDWLQRLVDDSHDYEVAVQEETEKSTLAMHTAWEGALKTFDAHFPGNSKPEPEPAGDVRTLDLREDLEALKTRKQTAMPLMIRVDGPLQLTINH